MTTRLLCVSGATAGRSGHHFSRNSLKFHEWTTDMTEPAKREWMLVEEYLKPFRKLSAIKKAFSRMLLRYTFVLDSYTNYLNLSHNYKDQ